MKRVFYRIAALYCLAGLTLPQAVAETLSELPPLLSFPSPDPRMPGTLMALDHSVHRAGELGVRRFQWFCQLAEAESDHCGLEYMIPMVVNAGGLLELELIAPNRDAIRASELPPSITGKCPAFNFKDDCFKTEYQRIFKELLDYLKSLAAVYQGAVDFISLGNEVDNYFFLHDDEIAPYRQFVADLVALAHQSLPGLAVGSVLAYHDLLANDQFSLYTDTLCPTADVVAFSVYVEPLEPHHSGTPVQVQDYLDLVSAMLDFTTGNGGACQVAIIETGVSADPAMPFGGSATVQQQVIPGLLSLYASHQSTLRFASVQFSVFPFIDAQDTLMEPYRSWTLGMSLYDFDATTNSITPRGVAGALRSAIANPSGFRIDHLVEGGWLNPDTPGQGMLLDYLPNADLLFVAWFGFDIAVAGKKSIGDPAQRWFTASLVLNGASAAGDLFSSQGGVFNAPPQAGQSTDKVGTLQIDFSACDAGSVTFSFDAGGPSGSFPIRALGRVVGTDPCL